jgi:hypothetical protein
MGGMGGIGSGRPRLNPERVEAAANYYSRNSNCTCGDLIIIFGLKPFQGTQAIAKGIELMKTNIYQNSKQECSQVA